MIWPFVIWLFACAHPAAVPAPPATESPSTEAPTPSPLAAYAGNTACTPCHTREAARWGRSKHARAWATLQAASSSHNPSCIPCHVVGYEAGGWPAPGFTDVGCEACHGPGGAHVAAPTLPYATPSEPCARCHTVDTSPDFDFAARWRRIAH